MSIQLRVADGSGPTGKILSDLLKERGVNLVEQGGNGVVSYGIRIGDPTVPTLNANAGGSKLIQLDLLYKAGIPVPSFDRITTHGYFENRRLTFPVLCRMANHRGGRDIALTLQPEDLPLRAQQGFTYATQFIPIKTEYRVWIYRRQHLGTYEKYLAYPNKYKRVGRNYDNGFAFRLVNSQNIPHEAVDIAAKAVTALKLDFGAVDILQSTKDNQFFVLEINTAPGVEGEGRQVIQGLASKIAKWVELGYPKRRGVDSE